MDTLFAPFRQSKLLNTLFLSNIFISFHYALVFYVNSSFLSKFFSEGQISTLYIIGSVIETILLLNASKITNKIGNYRFILITIILEFLAIIGLIAFNSPFLIASSFLLHIGVISLILFNLDLFVESVLQDETKTGSVRATYLTLMNIVIFISPSLIALLLLHNTYSFVYAISTIFLIPLYFCIKRFKFTPSAKMPDIRIKETILHYVRDKNLYSVFVTDFLLQLFYGFMVIYSPLYLIQHMGFNWTQVGIMFSIMLLPFVLFEVPVGDLEDKKYGEKEFLVIGFIIMGIATLCMSFITVKSFFFWTTILFISRIGASFVEISSESFFFKHVKSAESGVIGFFRISRPLAFIVAPLLITLALQFISFQYTFILMGALMICGVHYALGITDTK